VTSWTVVNERVAGILTFLTVAAATVGCQSRGLNREVADLVLTGGQVITVDAAGTTAAAVAVKGNRIVAIGGAEDVERWRGAQTETVALNGRTVLPGFIDSHSHVAGMANTEANYLNIQVPPLKDGAEIIAKMRKYAATLQPGAWIVGQGTYNQLMPTREELDEAFPDNPVELMWSVHDHLINHKAAITMGMTRAFPDPPRNTSGRYERTANGEVAIIRDAPAPWPRREFPYEQMKQGVHDVLRDFYLKRGVTTVSDHSSANSTRAYQELRAEGRLPTRVRLNLMAREGQLDAVLRTGLYTGMGDDWIRLGAIKIVLDGVWGTTAAVYEPFWEGSATTWVPNNRGGTNLDQAALNGAVASAHRAGWQVQIHANGDRAQDMVLTAFEEAQKALPRTDARHRVEHFGHFLVHDPERTEERLARMKQGGLIPSPQVSFLWRLTDVNVKEPNVKFFPMKTLLDRGFHPAGGVDTIGTQNFATYPLFSIARAVRRDTKYGTIVQPEEAISVMEGIRMFTIWAAYANFLEKSLGSVEVGKLADMIVLGGDPLTTPPAKLGEIPVDMTILDGRIAYKRQ
jgi:predicted amidohydrolase YtcJ